MGEVPEQQGNPLRLPKTPCSLVPRMRTRATSLRFLRCSRLVAEVGVGAVVAGALGLAQLPGVLWRPVAAVAKASNLGLPTAGDAAGVERRQRKLRPLDRRTSTGSLMQ